MWEIPKSYKGVIMKIKEVLIALSIALNFACSEDESKKQTKNTQKSAEATKETDEPQQTADQTEQNPDESSAGEEVATLNPDDLKRFYDFKLGNGICEFSFERETKEKGCELLLDKDYSDCIYSEREKVHDISCVEGKSFQEAISELYGV